MLDSFHERLPSDLVLLDSDDGRRLVGARRKNCLDRFSTLQRPLRPRASQLLFAKAHESHNAPGLDRKPPVGLLAACVLGS